MNYLLNLKFDIHYWWQLGDWRRLEHIDIQNASDDLIVMKAIAELQLGKTTLAKNTLLNLKIAPDKEIFKMLVSGVFNSLGRAYAILAEGQKAETYFVEAVNLSSLNASNFKICKARIEEQYAALGLNNPFYSKNKQIEENQSLRSCNLIETEEMHFTKNITIAFWIKIDKWPSKWTSVVSKSLDDNRNEFCLRIKNMDSGQWYFGTGDAAIILNNWSPKKHMKLNEWSHVALVKEYGQASRLYINGLMASIRYIQGLPESFGIKQTIQLLGSVQNERFVDGSISDFQLYNLSLSTKQIMQIMKNDMSLQVSPDIYLEFCDSRKKKLGALEKVEFQQSCYEKSEIAKKLRGLDYYDLIDKLKNKNILNIVIIGANDGKTNDPLYDYILQNSRQTRVFLFEPQKDLLPYLKENYAFHQDAHIINSAVGDAEKLTLYSVKPEFWSKLNVPYAQERGWPIYRAPSGVTSINFNHVQNWLKKHLETWDSVDAICKHEVPSRSLYSVLKEYEITEELDVLQVDTEGFDDYVIYSSDLFHTKPKIIHFESVHLSNERKKELYSYLESFGYQIFEIEEDSIALIVEVNWSY